MFPFPTRPIFGVIWGIFGCSREWKSAFHSLVGVKLCHHEQIRHINPCGDRRSGSSGVRYAHSVRRQQGVIRRPAEAVYLRSKYGKAGSASPARAGIRSA